MMERSSPHHFTPYPRPYSDDAPPQRCLKCGMERTVKHPHRHRLPGGEWQKAHIGCEPARAAKDGTGLSDTERSLLAAIAVYEASRDGRGRLGSDPAGLDSCARDVAESLSILLAERMTPDWSELRVRFAAHLRARRDATEDAFDRRFRETWAFADEECRGRRAQGKECDVETVFDELWAAGFAKKDAAE